jgi:SNF2 family DNA or RNA helicase
MQLNNEQLKLLSDYIDDYISPTMLTRGKTIIKNIQKIECLDEIYTAKVKGSNNEIYSVEITIISEDVTASTICSCPYYQSHFEDCKHIAAVALKLINNSKLAATPKEKVEKLIKSKIVQFAPNLSSKHKEPLPIISMEYRLEKLPDYWSIRVLTSNSDVAQKILNNSYKYHVKDLNFGKKIEMVDDKTLTNTFVEKAEKKYHLNIGCNCNTFKAINPCNHIWGLLLIVGRNKGANYFNKFEDYTIEKNNLLKPYGLTIDDDLANEFKFDFNLYGEFGLTNIPKGFLPKFNAEEREWKKIIDLLPPKKIKKEIVGIIDETIATKEVDPFDAAILFNLNDSALNGFKIEGLKITQKGEKVTYTQNKLKTKADLGIFNNVSSGIKSALFTITDEILLKTLSTKTSIYNLSSSQPFRNLTEEQKEIINSEYVTALQQLSPYLNNWKHLYFLANGNNFSQKNLEPCKFIAAPLEHKIILKANDKIIWVEVNLSLSTTKETIENYTSHKFLIKHNDTFYFMPTGLHLIKKYLPNNKLVAPIAAKNQFISNIVLPLSTQFEIDMGDIVNNEHISAEPQPRIYLSELNERFLMIRPKWLYETYELDNDNETTTILETSGGLVNIQRNPTQEMVLVDSLRNLHPSFQNQNNEYFYLHFDEVMKKNWFLTMYQQLQELNVPIFGMNNLKRFKYNTNTAKMDFKAGSGTDWFDIKMEVSYGDQIVPLATLRKAIINKQQFILLNDGTLGMLPEEWIKKFSTIMRMGTVKDDELQVSKLHWTIIDQLHEQQDDDSVFEELLAKKQKLKDIENVKTLKLPTNIKATLRDYQKTGFQWMNMLDEMGWGGCLADDMGLGKTLQTLTFLSGLQKKHKGETHLIVCPTSLIYNWESEINKFTPHLTYHINYGNERELSEKDVKKADIIITSYGILRSDIEKFTNYKFGYVILDESQAIKNHLSQTAKAVGLIKSRNRLILSGTPVQNNTFDLYAQFNFINPGLLGNMEFFKTEFANAIDRDNDKEKTEELRKLIYPFMLRRTKEQVAKDLPAKTETILWCEMEAKQRSIYNSFKEEYRKKILEKIETEGYSKAGIYILAGLTKLRQICDSPAILNEEEAYPNASIKIEELMREIEENASNHKALVFSQFTSMLGLIETELQKRKIKYYYLDGSTKAADRKIAVENFQENEDVKIFLISLKAGGVGLNLTAADYVYMVDPWWNPAAEQQAIDRTHRIGQTKSVFAYKLICKDSIEEKILELQNKKKALSADLISDENGFVKKLTKEDVAYLFS